MFYFDLMKAIDPASLKENNIVWIGGDLYLLVLLRRYSVQGNRYPWTVNHLFLDKINDLGPYQANQKPTRGYTIHDLFLINKPNLISRIIVISMDHHAIILTENCMKALKAKTAPKTVSLWKKANIRHGNQYRNTSPS